MVVTDNPEKLAKAKKNYESFWNKFKDYENKDDKLYASYVEIGGSSVIEDYYWTDNKITPTGLLKWFGSYEGITKVMIHKDKYDQLITMYQNPSTPLEVEGIVVIRNDTV